MPKAQDHTAIYKRIGIGLSFGEYETSINPLAKSAVLRGAQRGRTFI
jgi:hypothetical protein